MLRTNYECRLVPGITDGYINHAPGFDAFKALPVSWYKKGDTYTDQKRVFTLSIPAGWNPRIGAVAIKVDLDPNEELVFTFKLDNGEQVACRHCQQCHHDQSRPTYGYTASADVCRNDP